MTRRGPDTSLNLRKIREIRTNHDEEGTRYIIEFELKEQTFLSNFIKCPRYVKKSARFSRWESFNSVYMQYVIDKSWLIVESPRRNPDCLGVSKSFFSKWSYISSCISFSNNLLQIGCIGIVR